MQVPVETQAGSLRGAGGWYGRSIAFRTGANLPVERASGKLDKIQLGN
jgi:hypothetical protein